MPSRIVSFTRLLAAAAILVVIAEIASACPSCQQALASGGAGDLPRGIYYSVLFMMAMPFAIVGAWGGYIYRVVKQAERDRAGHPRPHHHPSEN